MDFFAIILALMFCTAYLGLILTLGWYALKRTQKTWGGR